MGAVVYYRFDMIYDVMKLLSATSSVSCGDVLQAFGPQTCEVRCGRKTQLRMKMSCKALPNTGEKVSRIFSAIRPQML